MKPKQLITQARATAERWLECDNALIDVNDTFGQPYEDNRGILNDMLMKAVEDEVSMDQFQGPESDFRFPDMGAMVIVKVSQLPTPTDMLETADLRIKKAEQQLKLAKAAKKNLVERYKINGHQFVTEKITTAFKRITK